MYRGADKSLAQSTSRYILFDGENISFDASLVIYINSTNIPPIMIINRIYETQNLLSLWLVSFLVRLRTYQHPCFCRSPVPALSKTLVYGCSLAGISGSNPAWGRDGCLSLVIDGSYQAYYSATGRSLVQRSSTEYGVSVSDLETSTMRRVRRSRHRGEKIIRYL